MFDQAVLDDFNRANVTPIPHDGAPWYMYASAGGRVVSNQWGPQTAPLGLFFANRYATAGPFTDCEAFVTLSAIVEWHVIAARLQHNASSSVEASGYYTQWAPGQFYIVRKNGASAQTILAGPFSVSLSAGDKLGIRCIGTAIQGWYYKTGAWTMAGSATDATYASGYLGLAVSNSGSSNSARLDDFGGGAPVTAPTFIPQIVIS